MPCMSYSLVLASTLDYRIETDPIRTVNYIYDTVETIWLPFYEDQHDLEVI
jgi:hypothetical protein